MRVQGARWLGPAVGSVLGVLALSGTAVGVDVGPVSVPGAGQLVPPTEIPSTPAPPPVSAPAPAPVAPRVEVPSVQVPSAQAPAAPKLQAPRQLQSAPKAPSPSTSAAQAGSGSSFASRGASTGSAEPRAGSSRVAGTAPQPRSHAGARTRQQRRKAGIRERRLRRLVENLSGCLSSVPSFDAAVLSLRAGLGDRTPLSRSQTGRRLGTSVKRIRRAERRGVRGLRNARARGACGGGGAAGSTGGGGPLDLRSGLQHAGVLTSAPAGADRGGQHEDSRKSTDGTDGKAAYRDAGAGAGKPTGSSTPPAPRSSNASSDGSALEPWMAVALLLVLATLALMLTTILGRGLPTRAAPASRQSRRAARGARRAAAKASIVSCAFCRSEHVAVNPREGVYRCAKCGFDGTLTDADASEVAKIEAHSHEGSGRKT